MHMPDTTTAIVGNLTDNPEVRSTEAGIARAMFRVAVSGPAGAGPSFFTVIVWRDQVEDVAESLVKGSRALVKGSRVGVVGRLQRSWTRKDGRAFYQTRLMCVCVIRDASANSGDGRAAAVVAQKPPR
jgi:single-stranded DNA-binding protein